MQIAIPIKQVPETGNVKMDEKTGTVHREGVECIVNPLDLYAIEVGIELKEKYGGKITIISMGPVSADRALREALAMGCDEAFLITGREFAGSDTWATALVLAKAIQKSSVYDIILTGERATDGETGQVGPEIASLLDIPLSTYTSRIINVDVESGFIVTERLIEEGYETLKLEFPCLLTVVKEISFPRLPTLRGKRRAKQAYIRRLSNEDLGFPKNEIGQNGSPTRVVKIYRPRVIRKGIKLNGQDDRDVDGVVERLVHYLKEKKYI